MSHFTVRVLYKDGISARDVAVMIEYSTWDGYDEKRTQPDGWIEFHNHGDKLRTIYVHATIWVHTP